MSAAVVTLTPTNNPEARRLVAGPLSQSEAAAVAAAELARLARCGFRTGHPRTGEAGTVYVCRHPTTGAELHLTVWTTEGGTDGPTR